MRIYKSTGRKAAFSLRAASRRRLLVADDDSMFARALADFFTGKGFETRVTYSVGTTREIVEFWHPEVIMADLLLPHTNALGLLKFINSKQFLVKPRVIVMSKQAMIEGIEAVKKAGAAGYLVKPFSFEDALRMADPVRFSQAAPAAKKPVASPEDGVDPTTKALLHELHLVNLFLRQALDTSRPEQNLFNLMRMVSLKVKAVRCSFIRCVDEENGIVLASNDDFSVSGLPIQLSKYPEVREVARTLKALLIPNVRSSELMAPVRDLLVKQKFETIAVFPIFVKGKFFGVTSLRMEQRDPVEMFYIDNFGQIAAQILSLSLAG